MNVFIKRIYIMVVIFAIAISILLIYEYHELDKDIQVEIETNINLKLILMNETIERHINQSVEAIESIEIFLKTEDDDSKILYFIEQKLLATPSYMSLYFGTPENKMINGSGWIPPEDFDLRTRPWYTKAIEENELITTSIYLNASQDSWIVTYAKPVYNQENELMGVIGGDNTLDSMVEILKSLTLSENGFSFLLDSNGTLIMHSMIESVGASEENEQIITAQLDSMFQETGEGVSLTTIDGEKGYIAWNKTQETGWIVGSFAPLTDFDYAKSKQSLILTFIVCITVVFLLILIFYQRRFIIKPFIQLNQDVQEISLKENMGYRLPIYKNGPYSAMRLIINDILTHASGYFDHMIENEKSLKAIEKKNRIILESMPDMFFIIDPNGIFLRSNVNDKIGLNIGDKYFLGKNLFDVLSESIASEAIEKINKAVDTDELQMLEFSLEIHKETEFFEARIVKIADNEVLSVVRRITEQKEYLRKIEKLSFYDQLTGLYNRRFYEEEINRLDTERNLPISLLLLDVNGLKLTNDTFGHLTGDELLKIVAKVLKSQCRHDEIIARIGGDEFVVLLPNTTEQESEKLGKRLQLEVGKEKIEDIPISISIGWQTKVDMNKKMNVIFSEAERHMYRKKVIESQSMRYNAIQLILSTLNAKNSREKIHSEKVSEIAKKIAKKMNLSDETIKEVEAAGVMHDIGKIAVDDSILNKKGPLSEEEYTEIKKHPENSYKLLKSVDVYSGLAEYVLSHHEHWDGNGYPQGLKGIEIPLVARIICIADAFEAMTSDRTYRKALLVSDAIAEIKRCSGTQFDPDIVIEFTEIFEKQ